MPLHAGHATPVAAPAGAASPRFTEPAAGRAPCASATPTPSTGASRAATPASARGAASPSERSDAYSTSNVDAGSSVGVTRLSPLASLSTPAPLAGGGTLAVASSSTARDRAVAAHGSALQPLNTYDLQDESYEEEDLHIDTIQTVGDVDADDAGSVAEAEYEEMQRQFQQRKTKNARRPGSSSSSVRHSGVGHVPSALTSQSRLSVSSAASRVGVTVGSQHRAPTASASAVAGAAASGKPPAAPARERRTVDPAVIARLVTPTAASAARNVSAPPPQPASTKPVRVVDPSLFERLYSEAGERQRSLEEQRAAADKRLARDLEEGRQKLLFAGAAARHKAMEDLTGDASDGHELAGGTQASNRLYEEGMKAVAKRKEAAAAAAEVPPEVRDAPWICPLCGSANSARAATCMNIVKYGKRVEPAQRVAAALLHGPGAGGAINVASAVTGPRSATAHVSVRVCGQPRPDTSFTPHISE
ncbi:hypothetical protein EON68_02195, partial [archaeon]